MAAYHPIPAIRLFFLWKIEKNKIDARSINDGDIALCIVLSWVATMVSLY